jgi:hypothetical protein
MPVDEIVTSRKTLGVGKPPCYEQPRSPGAPAFTAA